MKAIRGIINVILVATLVKPVVRWLIAREAALPPELAPLETSMSPRPGETVDELAGRDVVRIALIVAVAAAVVAASVLVITAVVRRRRLAEAPAPEAVIERVAVPVEVPVEAS